jgi:hypothetical protein
MTTSSTNQTKPSKRPSGDHWFEMTATLSAEDTAMLDDWVSESLQQLEVSLAHFSSPQSRGESATRR